METQILSAVHFPPRCGKREALPARKLDGLHGPPPRMGQEGMRARDPEERVSRLRSAREEMENGPKIEIGVGWAIGTSWFKLSCWACVLGNSLGIREENLGRTPGNAF